jgi:hypothetical protein
VNEITRLESLAGAPFGSQLIARASGRVLNGLAALPPRSAMSSTPEHASATPFDGDFSAGTSSVTRTTLVPLGITT